MKNGSRANALLIELLIVILFFMFAATTLVEIFGLARQKSQRAEITTAAVLEAQNVAESLYDAEEPESCLEEMGFAREAENWTAEYDGYSLCVSREDEETGAGVLRTMNVAVEYEGETLVTLPSTRYVEKEAEP